MGCNYSKLNHQPKLKLIKYPLTMMSSVPVPCIDAAAVADLLPNDDDDKHRAASITRPHDQATCIQDLPPLLLAHIFSKYLSWEDIHGSVSMVCKSWHQVAAEVTPHNLNFEFDLVQDALPSTGSKSESKTMLQLLLSQPAKLLQRLAGQLRQPQQDDQQGEDDEADNAADQSQQQQQFLQYLQNAPWERWIQQHGMQLQDFSMSITNLDSNCAAAQCQLKETLLKALAGSATPESSLSTSSSFVSSSGSSPRASDSSSEGDLSAPTTPLSFSCSEFSDVTTSSSNSSSDTNASCTSTTSSSSCCTSSLQLKSLHLRVPLFECDVLLLAHGVCSKAPDLKALSLVGYSSSGAVKTRSTTSITTTTSKTSRHRLPINRRSSSSNSLAAASGSNTAPPRGSDLIPVGNAGTLPPWSLSPASGRGGFITGSSLKQLMAAAPQLESLTFACRQLYKLNWLARATQLTYLSLRDCSLGGDLVKQLAALQLPKLRAVDLSGSKGLGGSNAAQHLQQLARIAGGQLQQVDISGWDLGSAGGPIRELPHLAGLQSLCELKMECCGLQGWGLQCGQLPALSSLSLSGNPLDSRGIAAVCSISQLRHLELAQVAPKEVALLPQTPPGQGPACWSGMQPMPHLTSLNLSGNFWPDVSVPDRSPVAAYRAFKHSLCSSLAGMSSLAKIDLAECKVPYSRTTHLLASLPPSVTEVVLDGAAEGIKRGGVEVLQELPKLRVLCACRCNVRDKHAGVLSGLCELRSLVLRDNALGPDGLAELMQGCSQLTLLDVTGNEKLSIQGSAGTNSSTSSGGSSSSSSSQCIANVHTAMGVDSQLLLLRD